MQRFFSRNLRAAANNSGSATAQLKQAAAFMSNVTNVQLPDLSYDYAELEPVISGQIMEIHHSKHHQTYVNNFNVAAEKYAAAIESGDVSGQIALHSALKFNGGGHINHALFWENLAPPKKGGGERPGDKSPLVAAINSEFGSMDAFIEKFNATTAAVQGSGWGWLGYDKVKKRVAIATCANQDPLEATTGLVPLLGIDVWEHAYYLQYTNARPQYLKAIWDVINWANVEERFAKAQN